MSTSPRRVLASHPIGDPGVSPMPDGVSPLLDVFLELRQREFPLGVREYLLALDALACGLGVGSREDLVFVCQTLWAKSVEEQLHVKDVLDRLLPPLRTNEELEALQARVARRTRVTGSGSRGRRRAFRGRDVARYALDSAPLGAVDRAHNRPEGAAAQGRAVRHRPGLQPGSCPRRGHRPGPSARMSGPPEACSTYWASYP